MRTALWNDRHKQRRKFITNGRFTHELFIYDLGYGQTYYGQGSMKQKCANSLANRCVIVFGSAERMFEISSVGGYLACGNFRNHIDWQRRLFGMGRQPWEDDNGRFQLSCFVWSEWLGMFPICCSWKHCFPTSRKVKIWLNLTHFDSSSTDVKCFNFKLCSLSLLTRPGIIPHYYSNTRRSIPRWNAKGRDLFPLHQIWMASNETVFASLASTSGDHRRGI